MQANWLVADVPVISNTCLVSERTDVPTLIEELEASAFSAKRHHINESEIPEIKEEASISTKVITRAISMARCRATPPLRNGLTEAHSEKPCDPPEVQHTSESI